MDYLKINPPCLFTSFELTLLNIPQLKIPDIIICVIYRPPGLNLDVFLQEFEILTEFLTSKNNKKKKIVMLGDFNIDLLSADSHQLTNDFLNSMIALHLLPLILKPTRITPTSSTLIDNIFTNAVDRITDSTIIMTDISDHLPIITRLINSPVIYRSHNKTKLTRTITNETLLTFKNMLSQTDWIPIKQLCLANETNLAYDSFISLIKYNYDLACPLHIKKTSKKNTPQNPWMTKGLLNSVKKKEKLYIAYIKNPTLDNKKIFTDFRNK